VESNGQDIRKLRAITFCIKGGRWPLRIRVIVLLLACATKTNNKSNAPQPSSESSNIPYYVVVYHRFEPVPGVVGVMIPPDRVRSPSKKTDDHPPPSPAKRRRKRPKTTAQPSHIAPLATNIIQVVEDFEEEEDEDFIDATVYAEDPLEALKAQRRNVSYLGSFKVMQRNNEKGIKRYTFKGNEGDVISRAHAYALERTGLEFQVDRTKVLASYPGLKKDRMFSNDVVNDTEFESCLDCLSEWASEGAKDISVTITVFVDKTAQFDGPSTAPIAAQKGSATARQTAALAIEKGDLEERGDYSVTIRAEWPCAIQSCPNNTRGKYCYRATGSDKAENHYPITKEVVIAWSKEMKAGHLDEKEPNPAIFNMMAKARERLYAQTFNRRKTSQTVQQQPNDPNKPQGSGFIQQQFFGISVQDLTALQKGGVLPIGRGQDTGDITPPRPSSAPTLTGPEELVIDCFQWLSFQPEWRGCEDDLGNMKDRLLEDGYDLDGISQIALPEWKALGLKGGHLGRLKRFIPKFKQQRKATTSPSGSVRASSGGEE
jgi:hypothetical protein